MKAALVCAIALSLTTTATAVHVLVVGDSMGEFEGCNDGTTYGSSAIAHCCSGATVTQAAIAGATAAQYAAGSCPMGPSCSGSSISTCSFNDAFDMSSGYTVVWLSIGGNDMLDNTGCTKTVSGVQADIAAVLSALRTSATSKGYATIPVVMTGYAQITSSYSCGTTPQMTNDILNAGIQAACEADSLCTFAGPTACDSTAAAGGSPSSWGSTTYHADQIHLNQAGYRLWFGRPTVQTALGCTGTSSCTVSGVAGTCPTPAPTAAPVASTTPAPTLAPTATTPAPTAANVVAATVSLAGVSASQFNEAAQTAFKEVVATYLTICGVSGTSQCTSSDVTITSSSRRDVSVVFTVATVSATEASTGATTLNTAITTNAATFKNALVAKGGNLASVTGTTTTSAPAATTATPATPTAAPTAATPHTDTSLSTGAIIGISVGGMFVFVLIIGAIIWVIASRHKEDIKHASGVHSTPNTVDNDDDGAAGVQMSAINIADEQKEEPEPASQTCKHQVQYAKMFKALDHDGDGKVTLEEMKSKLNLPEAEAAALFKSMDEDHDGLVGIEELSKHMAEAEIQDEDGDGDVDLDDVAVAGREKNDNES